MPEEAGSPADPGLQSPPEGGSQEVPATEETNWEQRYKDTQSNHDRLLTENNQYRSLFEDPANLAQAVYATGLDRDQLLAALGYELPEEETDEEDYSDEEFRDPRVDGLLEERDQQAQNAQLQEVQALEAEYVDQELSRLADAEGRDFTQAEVDDLAALAFHYADENGIPDFDTAYQHQSQVAEARHKAYVESKRAHAVGAGASGVESIDWSDPEESHQASVDAVQSVLDANQD